MRRFILDKAPFLRDVDEGINSTRKIMRNLLISLIPIIIFGWVLYGILPYAFGTTNSLYVFFRPLLNVIVGGLSSMIFECLYFFLFKKVRTFKSLVYETIYSFGIIPGVIISLLFPSNIPMYLIVVACFFANIIFKMLFGGLGHNIFNPAAVGYVIVATCFSGVISACLKEQGTLIEPIITSICKVSFISSATPLTLMKSIAASNGKYLMSYEQLCGEYGGLLNLFIGFQNGTLGEVSGLLCLVGFVYLIVKKVINWRVPVFYVGTVFIISWIIAIVNGIDGALGGIWFAVFNVLSGGLLFGAIFMATEPVTTPKNVHGKTIFGIACGICTVLLRFHGMYPEGVLTSILFVSLFTPFIDKFAAMNRRSFNDKKSVIRYIALSVLFILIIIYTVIKTTTIQTEMESLIAEVF